MQPSDRRDMSRCDFGGARLYGLALLASSGAERPEEVDADQSEDQRLPGGDGEVGVEG